MPEEQAIHPEKGRKDSGCRCGCGGAPAPRGQAATKPQIGSRVSVSVIIEVGYKYLVTWVAYRDLSLLSFDGLETTNTDKLFGALKNKVR